MLVESIALGLLLGAVCYSQFPAFFILLNKCSDLINLISLASMGIFLIYAYKSKLRRFFWLVAIILSIFFEIIWAHHHAQNRLAWQLPKKYQNQVVQLTGEIDGVPYYEPSKKEAKFIIAAETLCLSQDNHQLCESLSIPQSIKLYGQIVLNKNQILQSGDKITVTAKIKKPWGVSNPGGFDVEKNAFFNQIKAIGHIKSVISYTPCKNFGLDKLRQKIADNMLSSLDKDEVSGMLIGLTIGVTDRIYPHQWELLRQTGTTHLIAISGLHISLIGGLVFALMNMIWRRIPYLLLRLPANIAAAYVTILFTWGYGFLAGMSIATERACIMMTAVMLAIILKLRMSALFIFSLSLGLILLRDPFSVLAMGFWLSYLAIGVLIYATGNRLRFTREKLSWKIVRPQLAAFIGLLPLSLYFFQSTSLISPLVNVMAIPWVSFVVTPMCLLSALAFMLNINWLGSLAIIMAKYVYLPLWTLMQWIVSVIPAIWHFALPSGTSGIGLLVLSMLGVGIVLLPKGVPYKNRVGLCLLIPILCYQPVKLKHGEAKFALLDVGQGLASVIFTNNHVLIYDTGPKWQESDSGGQIIKPFLDYYHVKKIDTIMISHTDLDHRGGLESLVKHYKVAKIMTSEIERLKTKSGLTDLKPELCQQGQSWTWDGVFFEVLHPQEGSDQESNRNNLSCVLRISSNQYSILLTGDIETGAEEKLIKTYGQKLASTILIAPHHGSKTSSTLEFIQAVNPKFVLFPTGKDNRFGFPREQVLMRYQHRGIQLYNTAEEGAILFDLTPEKISQPKVWRKEQARFWNSNI